MNDKYKVTYYLNLWDADNMQTTTDTIVDFYELYDILHWIKTNRMKIKSIERIENEKITPKE